MTSVQSPSNIAFTLPVRPYAPSTAQRKNSVMSSTTPVLSSFAIDLIAQFDNYRVNMRESLQREVEENIYKAKVLKEAMKESSDRDAEILISEEEEYNKNGSSTPSNRSNTSLNRFQQTQQQSQQSSSINSYLNDKSGNGSKKEKKSTLEKLFGRKSNVNSKVTPLPSSNHPSPSLLPASFTAHGNYSTTHSANSATDLGEIKYLPVDEESEEEVLDRSITHGAGVGSLNGAPIGTEVKLHPTRAKTFALPKSLKNLKRRIAALRAKGTDLDAEKREKEAREKAANGGVGGGDEKKKFTLIRLLPWKSTKKSEPFTKPTDSVISPSNTMTSSIVA